MQLLERAERINISMMGRVRPVTESEYKSYLDMSPIPAVLLDNKANIDLNQIERNNPDGEYQQPIAMLVAHIRQQERMIRHLIVDSRKLKPIQVNLSKTGMLLDNSDSLDNGVRVHCNLLFPGSLIPFSILGKTVRLEDSKIPKKIAIMFEHKTPSEAYMIERFIVSFLDDKLTAG